MNLSAEAKVGLVSVVGVVILSLMVMWVGHLDFNDKGYPVQAVFRQVDGLVEGNPVRYAGVEVGKIIQVTVTPQGVLVKMQLRPGVTIPEGSKFTISSQGLLGEKYIEIIPNPNTNRYLGAGDQVTGVDPQRLDDLFNAADQLLRDIQKLVNNFNDVIGTEQSKAALKQTILNLQAITGNLEVFTASIQRMAVNSEQDIAVTAKNLRGMSERLLSASKQADAFMSEFAADGKTGIELKQTVESIRRTAQKIENMAATLEKEVTDPETMQSINTTVKNAQEVSEKANKILMELQNVKTEGGVEILSHEDAYQTNFDIRVRSGNKNFLQLGVNDIGEENKTNVQLGKQSGKLTSRIGLFDDKAGVGFDNQIGDRATITVEVIDPNDMRIKVRGQYLVEDNAILVQKEDINDSNQPTYIGVRKNF
jgi:phospholipid/cholesterol/gamma-HCH transport system substrate-binding protein